jgi:hypothetical protein
MEEALLLFSAVVASPCHPDGYAMSPAFTKVIKINKARIVTWTELVINIQEIYLQKYINFRYQ